MSASSKTVTVLFLSLSCFLCIEAQFPMKDIVPNSPNSAQSGVYGSVPVGLFTGTMQENINIYELKTKNLSLPVTLSYLSFASDFRPLA